MTDKVALTPEKKKKIEELVKSFKAADAAIEPYKQQKKDLRTSFIENQWLSNQEFSMVKKAYNSVKSRTDMDELSVFIDVVKAEMPEFGE